MSNINQQFQTKSNLVPPAEEPKLTPGALVFITVLMLFFGTILVTIGVGVTFGWSWALIVLGALVIVYGLITGNSI